MEDIRTVHLKILQDRLGEIAWEVTQIRFRARVVQPLWRPSINVYRCEKCIVICVELAGVDRAEIALRVEPLRVLLSGRRRPPEPDRDLGEVCQVFALEIDVGGFEREILLPHEIVPAGVRAEQRNGLLWIELPLQSPA